MPAAQIAVVLHDVAPPTWPACERLLACLASVDASLPLTYLVVPRYHGSTLASPAWQRALDGAAARGDDLALHGYTHLDVGSPPAGRIDAWRRRWYTQGEGEFAALDEDEAVQRLAAGRAWFAAQGWPLHGFVPPAWLIGAAARRAVESAGFDYTCSLSRLTALPRLGADGVWQPGVSLRSQSLVYSTRAAWRRRLSCVWNPAVAWAQQRGALLRFELHPWDADHPDVRRSWMRLLERALRTRRPVTLRQASSALRGPRPADLDEALHQALYAAQHAAHDMTRYAAQSGHSSNMPHAVASPVRAPASTSLG